MRIDSSTAAVVTGGASGLGLATVKALREAGMKVAILDLDPAAGARAEAETGATFCQADVTSEDSLDAAFAQARAAQGQERVLVCCAGGGQAGPVIARDPATGAIRRSSTADFARVMALNATGTYAAITRFAAGAAELDPVDDERGVILCTSSVAGQEGQETQAAYSAGKGALLGMTLPIARDLAHFAIRIVTIQPGPFLTPALARAPSAIHDNLLKDMTFPRRFGDPSEYASLVLEVVRNRFFNATSIRLDGGIRTSAS